MSSLNCTTPISTPLNLKLDLLHTQSQPVCSAQETGFRVKEPISALTHLVACVVAVFATPLLLIHAAMAGSSLVHLLSLSVFMLSMIMLYAASTLFHALDISPRTNIRLQKADHIMIFVLIAGTYTPVCTIAIGGATGVWLLGLVWGLALVGLVLKACWVTCPKWFSSVVYIGMGWICVFAIPEIVASLSIAGFLWLLIGGILYTVGGVIYALKLNALEKRFPGFGEHELFHLFVMAGSFCHFMTMWGL